VAVFNLAQWHKPINCMQSKADTAMHEVKIESDKKPLLFMAAKSTQRKWLDTEWSYEDHEKPIWQ
jgi:hypothetical protein